MRTLHEDRIPCGEVPPAYRPAHSVGPIENFELWYWTTLTAGTNAYNACLHLAGLTSDDPVFSTIPGVHLAQQPDGGYARVLRGPGDVSHVGWPPIEGEIPEDIQCLEIALEALEEHGTRACAVSAAPPGTSSANASANSNGCKRSCSRGPG